MNIKEDYKELKKKYLDEKDDDDLDQSTYYYTLKNPNDHQKINVLSIAILENRKGKKMHVQYQNQLTYESISSLLTYFDITYDLSGSLGYNLWKQRDFDVLMENKYVCQMVDLMFGQMYNLCITINFASIMSENKIQCDNIPYKSFATFSKSSATFGKIGQKRSEYYGC